VFFRVVSIFFLCYGALSAIEGLTYPSTISFGTIEEGQTGIAIAVFENQTTKPFVITSMKSSCGCTVPTPSSNVINPSGNVVLVVKVDSTGKRGMVKKNVRVNLEGETRPLLFFVEGVVNPKTVHLGKDQAHKMQGVSIFSKDCASCHVEPTKKRSLPSFSLVGCAFCHGTNRQGSSSGTIAPALVDPKPHWLQIITQGTYENGGKMPGFLGKHGGPLTEGQIASLVRFFEGEREQVKDQRERSGRELYLENCSACHGQDQTGGVGPALQGDQGVLRAHTKESLGEMLKKGSGHLMMPSFLREKGGRLSEGEVEKVVDFLLKF